MQEAYSHEVSSAGFWPGGAGTDAAFYSYAYPSPPGFKEYRVQPQGASFNESLGEFLLPYEQVRTAKDPAAELLSFLQSTYEAAAVTGKWDRAVSGMRARLARRASRPLGLIFPRMRR